jgi:hypothetical protein
MPIQRWRCPAAVRAKAAAAAALALTVTGVFFPLWFAVPVMAVYGAWCLAVCVRGVEFAVDPQAGLLWLRLGPIVRRVRLESITAVQVDRAKVTIARSDGLEISVYAWRRSRLDRWLRLPVVAGDVAHAISAAAAAAGPGVPAVDARARSGRDARRAGAAAPVQTVRWARGPLAATLVGVSGLAQLGAVFLVRVSWPNPALTAVGVILALALGVSGLVSVIVSVVMFLACRGRVAAA